MRKLILFMHTSLDGFVTDRKGEMDWIRADDELFDYTEKLIDQTDTALYGRITYQMMESYWPTAADQPNASTHDIHHSHWYANAAKIVVSKSMKGSNLANTHIISDNLPDEIQKLKQQPGKNIVIFGSPTASHSLMQHNLIDDYWLFVNPVLLGEGLPVFKNITDKVELNQRETNVFLSGVIGLHYEKK